MSVGRGGARGGIGVGPFSLSGGGGGGILSTLFQLVLYAALIAAFLLFQLWPIAVYLVSTLIAILSPVLILAAFGSGGFLVLALVATIGYRIPSHWLIYRFAKWVSRHRKLFVLLPIFVLPSTIAFYLVLTLLGLASEWRAVDRGTPIFLFIFAHVITAVTFLFRSGATIFLGQIDRSQFPSQFNYF